MEAARQVLTWDDCAELTARLAATVRQAIGRPEVILPISRGGLVPGALMATLLGQRNVLVASISSYDGRERRDELQFYHFPAADLLRGRKVLVVDDVWDTGATAMAVRARAREAGARPGIAVLHYKPERSLYPDDAPDWWVEQTDDWIVYPWENDGSDA